MITPKYQEQINGPNFFSLQKMLRSDMINFFKIMLKCGKGLIGWMQAEYVHTL